MTPPANCGLKGIVLLQGLRADIASCSPCRKKKLGTSSLTAELRSLSEKSEYFLSIMCDFAH